MDMSSGSQVPCWWDNEEPEDEDFNEEHKKQENETGALETKRLTGVALGESVGAHAQYSVFMLDGMVAYILVIRSQTPQGSTAQVRSTNIQFRSEWHMGIYVTGANFEHQSN